MMWNGYGDSGWGWGNWLAMTLMMLIFWGALAAVVIVVIRNTRRASAEPGQRDAVEILRERFARGEIDADEYRQRQAVLRGES